MMKNDPVYRETRSKSKTVQHLKPISGLLPKIEKTTQQEKPQRHPQPTTIWTIPHIGCSKCIYHVISVAFFLASTFLPLGFFTFSIFFTREPSIMMDRGDKRGLKLVIEGRKGVVIKLSVFF
jgi:hypothetical protein